MVYDIDIRYFHNLSKRMIPTVFCFHKPENQIHEKIICYLEKLCQKYPRVLCFKLSFEEYKRCHIELTLFESYDVWVFMNRKRAHIVSDNNLEDLECIFNYINNLCIHGLKTRWLSLVNRLNLEIKISILERVFGKSNSEKDKKNIERYNNGTHSYVYKDVQLPCDARQFIYPLSNSLNPKIFPITSKTEKTNIKFQNPEKRMKILKSPTGLNSNNFCENKFTKTNKKLIFVNYNDEHFNNNSGRNIITNMNCMNDLTTKSVTESFPKDGLIQDKRRFPKFSKEYYENFDDFNSEALHNPHMPTVFNSFKRPESKYSNKIFGCSQNPRTPSGISIIPEIELPSCDYAPKYLINKPDLLDVKNGQKNYNNLQLKSFVERNHSLLNLPAKNGNNKNQIEEMSYNKILNQGYMCSKPITYGMVSGNSQFKKIKRN